MSTSSTPSVLCVGVKHGGKSQTAAALTRRHGEITGQPVEVHSAGTQPGATINELSAEVSAGMMRRYRGSQSGPLDRISQH